MNTVLQWIEALALAIPVFFTTPFPYILLLIVALQWKRQIELERKLFSARLNTVTEGIFGSIFYGLVGGAIASVILLGLGVVFPKVPFFYLWLIAFVLMLFHVRYFSFSYAGAILALLVLLARWMPQAADISWLTSIWVHLGDVYLPSLFALVAVLQLIESMLIYYLGGKKGTPIFIQSKRGKLVGGIQNQHVWLVPIFLVIENGQAAIPAPYLHWPLFSSPDATSFSVALLPAALLFVQQAITSPPEVQARTWSKATCLYSLLLLCLAFGAIYIPELIYLAILFSIGTLEGVRIYLQRNQEDKAPYYVHPKEGVKILAVIPHTPAEKMGLKSGEVITKVNGISIHRRKELYQALKTNLAFCKLEVINLDGHLKFAKSSLYQQDHHQLGVILAPDDGTPYYMEQHTLSLYQSIRQRILKRNYNQSIDL